MKLEKIVVYDCEIVGTLKGRKRERVVRGVFYNVIGHGGGIHIPRTEEKSIDLLNSALVKKLVEQFVYCIENKIETPAWKHHPHAGYYGTYVSIRIPKWLEKARIEIPDLIEVRIPSEGFILNFSKSEVNS